MMDARTAKHHPLPIDGHALFRIPGKGADAENGFRLIFPKDDAEGVQRRMLRAPKFRAVQFYIRAVFPIDGSDHGMRQQLVSVQHFDVRNAVAHDDPFDPNAFRCNGQGGDANPVPDDLLFAAEPQPYRPIDARAGIPAGIGLIGVMGDHGDFVFPVFVEQPV